MLAASFCGTAQNTCNVECGCTRSDIAGWASWSIPATCTSLELNNTGLTDSDARSIAEILLENNDVEFVNVTDNFIKVAGMEALVHASMRQHFGLEMGIQKHRDSLLYRAGAGSIGGTLGGAASGAASAGLAIGVVAPVLVGGPLAWAGLAAAWTAASPAVAGAAIYAAAGAAATATGTAVAGAAGMGAMYGAGAGAVAGAVTGTMADDAGTAGEYGATSGGVVGLLAGGHAAYAGYQSIVAAKLAAGAGAVGTGAAQMDTDEAKKLKDKEEELMMGGGALAGGGWVVDAVKNAKFLRKESAQRKMKEAGFDAAHKMDLGWARRMTKRLCETSDMCSRNTFEMMKSALNLACNYDSKSQLMNRGTMKGQSSLYDTLKAAGKGDEFWQMLGGGCSGKKWHADSDRCQEWKMDQIALGNAHRIDRSPASLAALNRKLSDVETFLKCATALRDVMDGSFLMAVRADMDLFYNFVNAAS